MWTYFSSVLLQRDGPPLCVPHVERVKVGRSPGLHQLRLQEEQAAHADRHAQQDPQPLRSGAGGPDRVAPESLHLGGGRTRAGRETLLQKKRNSGEKRLTTSFHSQNFRVCGWRASKIKESSKIYIFVILIFISISLVESVYKFTRQSISGCYIGVCTQRNVEPFSCSLRIFYCVTVTNPT